MTYNVLSGRLSLYTTTTDVVKDLHCKVQEGVQGLEVKRQGQGQEQGHEVQERGQGLKISNLKSELHHNTTTMRADVAGMQKICSSENVSLFLRFAHKALVSSPGSSPANSRYYCTNVLADE